MRDSPTRRVTIEWPLAEQRLPQRYAERELIGARVGGPTEKLLGGHVRGGTHEHAGGRSGAATARDRQILVVRLLLPSGHLGLVEVAAPARSRRPAPDRRADDRVLRLEVAMDDPERMSGGETPRSLNVDRHDVSPRACARFGSRRHAHPTRQRLAANELPRQIQLISVGADVVDRGDVGVTQPRHRACLAKQALANVDPAIVQQLERDAAIQLGVERGPDRPHAADPESVQQGETTDPRGADGLALAHQPGEHPRSHPGRLGVFVVGRRRRERLQAREVPAIHRSPMIVEAPGVTRAANAERPRTRFRDRDAVWCVYPFSGNDSPPRAWYPSRASPVSAMVGDDFKLLRAWREGNRHAASELFSRHFGPVYAFFRSKVDDVAEDLAQHTFMRCVEARDDFEGRATFRTYLFVIARSVLYDHLRKRAVREVVDFDVVSLEDLGMSPSRLVEAREGRKLLVHALRRLPVDLQIALELYYVQQIRGRELVDALGIPSGTVRSRIRRGLEQLRANMTELGAVTARLRTTATDVAAWATELRAATAGSEPSAAGESNPASRRSPPAATPAGNRK